jgi:serine phosphatase RsbU (regulator of sigma subunit)
MQILRPFSCYLLGVYLCICGFFDVFAQKTIVLKSQETYTVGKSILYYEDIDKKLSFQDVLADSTTQQIQPQINWQFYPADNLNLGLKLSGLWIKAVFKNTTQKNDWLLAMSYPAADTFAVYQKINGSWQKKIYSDRQPFPLRDFQYHDYVVPLHLPDNEPHTIYMYVFNTGSLSVPIEVLEHKTFTESVIIKEIGYGLYYGIMLAMVLYNLFIFFSLRDVSYIYYILSIVFTTIFLGSVTGHTFHYLLPNTIWFQNGSSMVGMFGWVASSAIFTITFLSSAKYTKILTKVLYGNVIIGVVGCLNSLTAPYTIMVRIGAVMVAINTLIILATTITNTLRGNKVARYFTFAWAMFLFSIFTIVLARVGMLPTNFFTTHGVEIGSAIEVILLSFALSDRYKLLKRANEKLQNDALILQKHATETLEYKVKERTTELRETVEELHQTNEELQSTIDLTKEQKRIIEKKNTDITASIQYAKRIQTAMMPVKTKMQEWLPKHFVFLKPRDIVSGDFYWAAEKEGKIFLAAADCTGHGVPGALMSMVGSNILNDIITIKNITDTSIILDKLRKGIITTLQQDTTENRDGLDIAICAIDKKQRIIDYSGANNGLFYIKNIEGNSTTTFIKADKMTIGGMQIKNQPFTKHSIIVPENEDTSFYIYSDGYQDQFGGETGRKLLVRGFHALLLSIHTLPMQDQKQALQNHLDTWLNEENEQIDDILVIGFKID